MDNRTPEERHKNMSAVRSTNTQPELRLRKGLWRAGLRYFTSRGWKSLTGVSLPGSPDIVFPSARLVVFVDGCFWHGCPVHYQAPAERQEFWAHKLAINMERDKRANEELTHSGWKVIRIWEHDLSRKNLAETLSTLIEEIKQGPTAQAVVSSEGGQS